MPPTPRMSASLPPAFAKQLQTDVEARLRTRLGIKPTDPTPPELQQLVAQEITASAMPLLKNRVTSEVQGRLTGIAQTRTLERFKENLGFAKTGITAIAAAADVDEILKKRAELLFKKKKALETAGFTPDQAMQIVLGDIAAKTR